MPDQYEVASGGTLEVKPSGVLENDTINGVKHDPNQPKVVAVLDKQPTSGVLKDLKLKEDGSFIYFAPNVTVNTFATFTYHMHDKFADKDSNETTVTIKILARTPAPPLNGKKEREPWKEPPLPGGKKKVGIVIGDLGDLELFVTGPARQVSGTNVLSTDQDNGVRSAVNASTSTTATSCSGVPGTYSHALLYTTGSGGCGASEPPTPGGGTDFATIDVLGGVCTVSPVPPTTVVNTPNPPVIGSNNATFTNPNVSVYYTCNNNNTVTIISMERLS
ncbi:MAG: hypothetical protein HY559_06950 [Gammaproteobacteria bacterium]|nr:hypothetical protein [Gammaproteobacteria bacterium]